MHLLLALLLSTALAADPFDVRFDTTEGPVVVRFLPDWAPEGSERVRTLVEDGFYDDVTFHRVLKGFMAPFGIPADPSRADAYPAIPDDPVTQSNTRGRVTFVTSGPNRRTTQMFVNTTDSSSLDAQGFAPVGEVVEGMKAFDKLFHRYGDGPPRGRGPDQRCAKEEGNIYLEAFPKLDRITGAELISAGSP